MTHILVCDTQSAHYELVKWTFFHDPSIVVEGLTNPLDVAIKLAEKTPDLVILDCQLAMAFDSALATLIQSKNISVLYTLSEDDLQNPAMQNLVITGDYCLTPLNEQELANRVQRLCDIPTISVIICTPHMDLAKQVQWGLASTGILVWPHQELESLREAITVHQASAVIWDIQSYETSKATLLHAINQYCPVITLMPSELDADKLNMAIQTSDFVSLPFTPIDIETRLKKQLRKTPKKPPASPFAQNGTRPKTVQTEMDQLKVALHHEIRNPLTSIMIGTQALNPYFQVGTPEKTVLDGIEKSSHRIKAIMDAIATDERFSVQEYMDGIQMLKIPS